MLENCNREAIQNALDLLLSNKDSYRFIEYENCASGFILRANGFSYERVSKMSVSEISYNLGVILNVPKVETYAISLAASTDTTADGAIKVYEHLLSGKRIEDFEFHGTTFGKEFMGE